MPNYKVDYANLFADFEERQRLIRHFEKVFSDAAQHRSKRPDWVEFERNAMWQATNAERKRLGKEAVSYEAIELAEQTCLGHVDYAAKYVLCCVEMVEGP